MVITLQHGNWETKQALIDLGCFIDILLWDAL